MSSACSRTLLCISTHDPVQLSDCWAIFWWWLNSLKRRRTKWHSFYFRSPALLRGLPSSSSASSSSWVTQVSQSCSALCLPRLPLVLSMSLVVLRYEWFIVIDIATRHQDLSKQLIFIAYTTGWKRVIAYTVVHARTQPAVVSLTHHYWQKCPSCCKRRKQKALENYDGNGTHVRGFHVPTN